MDESQCASSPTPARAPTRPRTPPPPLPESADTGRREPEYKPLGVWLGGVGGIGGRGWGKGCGKSAVLFVYRPDLFGYDNAAYTNHKKGGKKGGSTTVVKLSSVDRRLVVTVKLLRETLGYAHETWNEDNRSESNRSSTPCPLTLSFPTGHHRHHQNNKPKHFSYVEYSHKSGPTASIAPHSVDRICRQFRRLSASASSSGYRHFESTATIFLVPAPT